MKQPRYKLAVSDLVEFACPFTLGDRDKQRDFGLLLQATRAPQPEKGDGTTVGQFLTGPAAITMLGWVDDKSPLVDADTNQTIASGADALDALYGLVPNMPGLVLSAYIDATGAKAKLGN